MVVVEERQLLKPTTGSIWGSGEYLGFGPRHSLRMDRRLSRP